VIQAPIYNWQEFPTTAGALIRQRVRWYRGGIEAFLKHKASIWTKLKAVLAADVMLTLLGSIPGALILLAYASMLAVLPQAIANNATLPFVVGMGLYQGLYVSLLVGVISVTYPKGTRMRLVKRIPISYYYSVLLSISSMKAILDVVLRRPGVWARSVKTGMIDPLVPSLQTGLAASVGLSVPGPEEKSATSTPAGALRNW
jgi:cellulose synthase/poly-beta-1,6-N-acetylglucosamine synthase-like glycosyltransferase